MALLASAVSLAGRALPGTRLGRLLILIYHRVHARPDPMFPGEVDRERFDMQMSVLRRHCAPVPLAEAVQRLKRSDLPPRAVAVTFDDGYADNATVALPILQHYGIRATFFVAPGFLGGGRMWNDSIIESIRRASGASIDLTEFGLGIVTPGPDWTRGDLALTVIRELKHRPQEERQRRVLYLCDAIGASLPDNLMMSREQVRQLADAGMEIGAHTMTHPILRTLSREVAESEIRDSRRELELITGRPVRAFAYPNGRLGEDYTERDRNLVETLGFDYAPTTSWGVATDTSDRLQLPRFTPWDRTEQRWLARLLLAFERPA